MHVLRIYLRSGAQIELLYRGKGDARAATHLLETESGRVRLSDDFGKDLNVRADAVDGWQPSDYAAELEGALAIARDKQLANEKHQREVAARHGMIGTAGPGMQGLPGLPGNGRLVNA